MGGEGARHGGQGESEDGRRTPKVSWRKEGQQLTQQLMASWERRQGLKVEKQRATLEI